MNRILVIPGLLILPWLIIGVWYAGTIYAEYDHIHQLMSELGETGSATETISPMVNNYPVGILFLMFAFGFYSTTEINRHQLYVAFALAFHGLGSILAGYFACDKGCQLLGGSATQNMHTVAGISMFVSLFIAGYYSLRVFKGAAYSAFTQFVLGFLQ